MSNALSTKANLKAEYYMAMYPYQENDRKKFVRLSVNAKLGRDYKNFLQKANDSNYDKSVENGL